MHSLPHRPTSRPRGSFLALCLGAVLLFPTLAGASENEAPVSPQNEMCPVMTDEPIDPQISTEYRGQTVYLCCRRCLRTFLENPEQYVEFLPAGYFDDPVADEPGEHEHNHEHDTEHEHDHDTEHEHDHAHGAHDGHVHHEPETAAGRWIAFAGKFHPVVVHFPIALAFAALLAEALSLRFRPEYFLAAGRFSLHLAAISALLAAPLGWAAAAYASYPALELTLEWHRWLGIAATVLLIAAAITGEIRIRRSGNERLAWTYRGILLAAVIATGITGHLGAVLIFGPGHFTLPG